ncbi:hypothetical protein WG219_05085 [Ectopseudomonas mendocina]|uniref:Transmembrane protein n=1 Tax=Ectopseudomonas mendocina TaxID=300 RepID=A0ABZ2RL83_ECTME
MRIPSFAINAFLFFFFLTITYSLCAPFLPGSFETVRDVIERLSPPASVTGPADATDTAPLVPPVAGGGGETG